MISIRPILKSFADLFRLIQRFVTATLIGLKNAVIQLASLFKELISEIYKVSVKAISLSWKGISFIQTWTADLLQFLLVFGLYIGALASPFAVAIFPANDPFFGKYGQLSIPLLITKLIALFITVVFAFLVVKNLYQSVRRISNVTDDVEEEKQGIFESIVSFTSWAGSWVILFCITAYITIARLDVIGIDPSNWMPEGLYNKAATQSIIAQDSTIEPVSPPIEVAETENATLYPKLSQFINEETYRWRGFKNQGLDMETEFTAKRINSGLQITIYFFEAQYHPNAYFNSVKNTDKFQTNIVLNARQVCEGCKSFYEQEIDTNMSFVDGKFIGLKKTVKAIIPASVVEKADEISVSLLGTNRTVFLFPQHINLL